MLASPLTRYAQDSGTLLTISDREASGVLVGAFQSEREEETRDRAERGSVVRGSDQASVAPKRIPVADQARWTVGNER